MADFSSALYLGMRHPAGTLAWETLTAGKPAALREPDGAAALADRLARLIGAEQAVLLPSTLHLFWDLFALLAREDIVIALDAASYPIARWGIVRVAARGVPVACFPPHSPAALALLVRRALSLRRRPVVVTDGYSPAAGACAPLAAYAAIARDGGGYLVVDDTQALGVFGAWPSPCAPYGRGGGGALARAAVAGPHVICAASLAKGFGTPLAVLAASGALLRRFRDASQTRVHCSPPDGAAIAAGSRALALNQACGDRLRSVLWRRVGQLRARLGAAGLRLGAGAFPVQGALPPAGVDGRLLHALLAREGVAALLQPGRQGPRLGFLVTACHTPAEIDHAARAVARCLPHACSAGRKPDAAPSNIMPRWRTRRAHEAAIAV